MPQSLNLFRVFCIIHWTLIVICHKSVLNSLSSVVVFLLGLLLQKVLAYCALTIPAIKGNWVRPKKMMWFPLPVRVYLKLAVSKNFYGICYGSAPYGWLTGGFKGVRRREWRKNKLTGTTPFLGLNRRSVPTMEHQ
jgi:hypothetical protein